MSKNNSSYGQIIKSTSIFGGVQVINIIIGIIRTKVVAILLGPSGVGIISIYQSIIDLVKSTSTLGIDTGAIKEIASKNDNKEEQSKAISVFRWWVVLTASLGAAICLLFCYPISIWAFGDGIYALPIAFLSLSVLFNALSAGQTVIMQGLRLITSMAKATLIGNFAGLVISLSLYFMMGIKGIIPAFILSSVALFFVTSYYKNKVKITYIKIENKEAFNLGLSNLKLGLYVVGVSILNTAGMFLVRSFINKTMTLDDVGIFQAAWTITNIYLAMVLKSMGTDYYPRLCSVSDDNNRMTKLINEQLYIAILVAIPVVVIMILFSSFLLPLLYSGKFIDASELLYWQIAGSFFKVLSWPMAFVMLAKNRGRYFLISEILFYIIYLGLGFVWFSELKLVAFGISYLAAYVAYLIIVFIISKKICDYKWTKENILMTITSLIFIILAIVTILFSNEYFLPISIILSLTTVVYSLFMLNKILNINSLIVKIKNNLLKRK